MDIIKSIEQAQLKDNLPEFRVGDTVQVHYSIIEGARERIQVFEGTVIKRQGGSINETFTVRRLSYGVGVERTFPVHSPRIAELKVLKRGKVRRAKLYYLRDRQGKAAKVKEKKFWLLIGIALAVPILLDSVQNKESSRCHEKTTYFTIGIRGLIVRRLHRTK